MPLSDAYATAAEYRARVTKSDTGDDAAILAQLKAVARLFDLECDRHFTNDAAVVTRTYDGNGCDRLRVDDIASTTGLIVKVDLNGDYDVSDSNETLTINTHFWVAPVNADKEAEPKPWTHLEIVPDNAVLSIFPAQKRAVQVTASFGWPAVPGAIREANIMVVRELRDLEEAGFTLDLQNIDQAVHLSPAAFSMVERIKSQYGRTAVIR